MSRPIVGVGRLFGADPRAGEVGYICDGGRFAIDCGDDSCQGLADGLHHRRVKRVLDGETLADHVGGLEPRLEALDALKGTACHAQRRGVDRGEGQAVTEVGGQVRLDLVFRETDGEHRALLKLLDQSSALADKTKRIGQREDARHTRRHVLAEAVADHRIGMYPQIHPQRGQRILDDEEGRLGERRPAEPPQIITVP